MREAEPQYLVKPFDADFGNTPSRFQSFKNQIKKSDLLLESYIKGIKFSV